ncbi:MAG: hypothetical protein R2744_01965 [Bacteroidales bacterium]
MAAYGYDPGAGIPPPEPGHDSLRVDYLMPSASLSYYSTRLDSNHPDYDVKVMYDLLLQTSGYYQHHAGMAISAGYNLKLFYAKVMAGYEYYSFAPAIDFRKAKAPGLIRPLDQQEFKRMVIQGGY